MYFKLSLTAAKLSLHPDGVDPLVLWTGRSRSAKVTLSSVEAHGDVSLRCVVETERDPNPTITEGFECLAAGRLPPGHRPRNEWKRGFDDIDADGTIRACWIPPMWLMPQSLRDFAIQLSNQLYEAAHAALGVLRWRSRTLGSPQPFSSVGIEWSKDRNTWHAMPADTAVELGDVARIEISPSTAVELQALLESEREPLAHGLLREAWELRSRNPRSALVIGVTALEVGAKHYISACVPGARWLAENAPTPDVVKMLVEYIPDLLPPSGRTRTKMLEGETRTVLKEAVQIRNRIVHRGADVERERVAMTLRAIRNVLWQLDAALGHEWAAAYVSPTLDRDPSVGYRHV